MSDFEDESEELSPEEQADIESSIEMEIEFFRLLSGTEKIEVVPIPDPDGDILDPEQLKLIQQECKRQNLRLLYRIGHKTHSTIFDPKTKLTGVVPDNHRGFYC